MCILAEIRALVCGGRGGGCCCFCRPPFYKGVTPIWGVLAYFLIEPEPTVNEVLICLSNFLLCVFVGCVLFPISLHAVQV